MVSVQELKEALIDRDLFMPSANDFEEAYRKTALDPEIGGALGISTYPVEDITDLLGVSGSGRIEVLRADKTAYTSHKGNVIAGLILRRIMEGKLPREGTDTLIDCGSYNSAKALSEISKIIGFNGVYVMSRFWTDHLIEELEREDETTFKVIRAPQIYPTIDEREFSEHLLELLKVHAFRKNKCYLSHIREGGKALYPLGLETAKTLHQKPDAIIIAVGSGSTLEGIACAVQDYYDNNPEIIVAEAEEHPIFAKLKPSKESRGSPEIVLSTPGITDFDMTDYFSPPRDTGVPNGMIGTHYNRTYIRKENIARISSVQQISLNDWVYMKRFLEMEDFGVGNTSAACLNVATHLGNEGRNVLTMIFEPNRNYIAHPRG